VKVKGLKLRGIGYGVKVMGLNGVKEIRLKV